MILNWEISKISDCRQLGDHDQEAGSPEGRPGVELEYVGRPLVAGGVGEGRSAGQEEEARVRAPGHEGE